MTESSTAPEEPEETEEEFAEAQAISRKIDDANRGMRRAVATVLTPLLGDAARDLWSQSAARPQAAIEAAFPELEPRLRHDVAFHLTDWFGDAAFLVALAAAPQRFTSDEIRSGVVNFLHAPNHVAAAAKLAGMPVQDIFGVGALRGREPADEERRLAALPPAI